MRIHFLPAEQEKRNDKAIVKLRLIGFLLFILLMTTIVFGALLYLRPPVTRTGLQLTSDDGQASESEAVVLTSDLVLTPTKIDNAAEFIAPGERRNAHRINSTTLPDGTYMTLMRLESPTSAEPVTPVVVEPGQGLVAIALGQEWHGSARAKTNGLYPVDPDFTLNSGTAVYRESERMSLVGFAVKTKAGSAIVPAQEIINRFPEANSGR